MMGKKVDDTYVVKRRSMSFSLHDTLPKVGDCTGMEFYNKSKLRTLLQVRSLTTN
jgi:hypothetical protein